MLCKPSNKEFTALTPKMALELAAPHTWPASIMPALLASCIAAADTKTVSISASLVCLVIVVLMQAAVNTFNDYYDYVKGADSAEDNLDPTDAVLIYNNVNPKSALRLAIGFLAVAFLLGIYVIYRAGIAPLIIALIGALFVVAYSAGKTPVSYLPIGEVVSGIVMGLLIPLATYMAITLELNFKLLLLGLPCAIGIGLIMMTNNTCDIEKDAVAERKTLPVLLGRQKAVRVYHFLLAFMVIAAIVLVGAFYTNGLLVAPFMLLASYPTLKALLANPLVQASRRQAMPQILSVNVIIATFYAASILAGGLITCML